MRIFLRGHGPLQNYPEAKVTWEDVWVRYAPPRRGRKYLSEGMREGRWAPTLIGRLDLESELERARDYPRNAQWAAEAQLELAEPRTLRKLLRRYPVIPLREDVYCRHELIGRRLAEKMIATLLDSRLNGSEQERLKPYRFVWVRCKEVVTPMTLKRRKKGAT